MVLDIFKQPFLRNRDSKMYFMNKD